MLPQMAPKMAQNVAKTAKMLPQMAQNVAKNGPKCCHKWPKMLPQMAQKCCHKWPKMLPQMAQNVAKMAQNVEQQKVPR
jgi:hypothetical protein